MKAASFPHSSVKFHVFLHTGLQRKPLLQAHVVQMFNNTPADGRFVSLSDLVDARCNVLLVSSLRALKVVHAVHGGLLALGLWAACSGLVGCLLWACGPCDNLFNQVVNMDLPYARGLIR